MSASTFYSNTAAVVISLLSTISLCAQYELENVQMVHFNVRSGQRMALYDSAENQILLADYYGENDLDPSLSESLITPAMGQGTFIQKLDSSGNLIWGRTLSTGANTGTKLSKACVDNEGNIYIAASTNGNARFEIDGEEFWVGDDYDPNYDFVTSLFIVKIDADGNTLWVAPLYGSPGTRRLTGIDTDINNNVIVTGYFDSDLDFDPGAGQNVIDGGIVDGFVDQAVFYWKLSASNGIPEWVKILRSPLTGESTSHGIVFDNENNFYTYGSMAVGMDFDLGAGVFTIDSAVEGSSELSLSHYIAKYDAEGNLIWAKNLGDSTGLGDETGNVRTRDIDEFDLKIASNGDVVLGVYVLGSVDLDPGDGVYNVEQEDNEGKVGLIRLDSDGNLIWSQLIEAQTINAGISIRLIPLSNGNVFAWLHGGIHEGELINNPDEFYTTLIDGDGEVIWMEKDPVDSGLLSWELRSFSELSDGRINCYAFALFSPIVSFNGDFILPDIVDGITCYGLTCTINIPQVQGRFYIDQNDNCSFDYLGYFGFEDVFEQNQSNVSFLIQPGAIEVSTNEFGFWSLNDLVPGEYTIEAHPGADWSVCSASSTFTISADTDVHSFIPVGMQYSSPCSNPEVIVSAPLFDYCNGGTTFVKICNKSNSTSVFSGGQVKVEFSEALDPINSFDPYTEIDPQTFLFDIVDLYPGLCDYIQINTGMNCSVPEGSVACIDAEIIVDNPCAEEYGIAPDYEGLVPPCEEPYDGSILSIEGTCENEVISFIVTNEAEAGVGDMVCPTEVRFYVNDEFAGAESLMLNGGESYTYSLDGVIDAVVAQVDQHPLYPGESFPSAYMELCSLFPENNLGYVLQYPMDDEEYLTDNYCFELTDYRSEQMLLTLPKGITDENYILPHQPIEYFLEFENTGEEDFYSIDIVLTLDPWLDPKSIEDIASHRDYLHFASNSNMFYMRTAGLNAGELGYASFKIRPYADVPDGTVITNHALITFEGSEPVLSNEVFHTINYNLQSSIIDNLTELNLSSENELRIFPNPANDVIQIQG